MIKPFRKTLFLAAVLLLSGELLGDSPFQEKTFLSSDYLFKLQTPYGWRYANLNENASLSLIGPRQDEFIMVFSGDPSVLNGKEFNEYAGNTAGDLAANLDSGEVNEGLSLEINGLQAVQHEITANFESDNGETVGISYIITHVLSEKGFYQIHSWTGTASFAGRRMQLLKIIESFSELPGVSEIKEAEKLVENLGFSYFISELPDAFKQTMSIFDKSPKFTGLGSKVFNSKRTKAAAAMFVANITDSQQIIELNKAMENPLFSRILNEAEKSETSAGKKDRKKFESSLKMDDPKVKKRLELVEDAIYAAQLPEKNADAVIGLVELVLYSYLNGAQKDYNTSEIQDKLNLQWEKYRKKYDEELRMEFLYIFRNLSDDEIREYTEFFESSQGRYCIQLYRQTLSFIYDDGSRSIVKIL